MIATYIHHGPDFNIAPALFVCCCPRLNPGERGNSAMRRVAIVRGSGYDTDLSGKASISAANSLVAASPDNCASLAASCQGSTSDRANPESTLTSMPFLSTPIGANKKSLNSDPGIEIGTDVMWLSTEVAGANSGIEPYRKTICRARFGKYLSARLLRAYATT